jgi:hypothetical protein
MSVAQKQAKEKIVKFMIATMSKVKNRQRRERVTLPYLGVVAGERRLGNSLRRRMALTAKRVAYSGRVSDN